MSLTPVPDSTLERFFIGALPRNQWLRSQAIMSVVRRDTHALSEYQKPNWHHCLRIMWQLVNLGIAEYKVVGSGSSLYPSFLLPLDDQEVRS